MPTAGDEEPRLTLDEAYRAAWHFIARYAMREPASAAERFRFMLGNMELDGHRQTSDPATWHGWIGSVDTALASTDLPFPHLHDKD